MTEKEIQNIIQLQRNYFATGKTLPVENRVLALRKLYSTIKKRRSDIQTALNKDLGKSAMEAYMCEIGLGLSEISYMIKHAAALAKPRKKSTPIALQPASSYVKPVPYGVVLIMSPWNYPFLLSVDPLADAIAAGNTVILKPSAYSPATSALIEEILTDIFPPEFVSVVTGGRAENQALLQQKFDMIFFTGSQTVGKTVLHAAADHLTPAVLELGGKSPCIVDATANLKRTAQRIVWGKFLNLGQTCVAPDYILCQESIRDALIEEIELQIRKQFGKKPLDNKNYGKIISSKHFDRIIRLIDPRKVIIGGKANQARLQIEPTVMTYVNWDDPVMQEEIFGPVLPVLTFTDIKEIPALLSDKQKPLAFYVFSKDKRNIRLLFSRCQFGGGCINDVIIHLATSAMGFGGVGESGMGAYHGEEGFRAFSHRKSIVEKKDIVEFPMRYQPYRKLYGKVMNVFVK